MKVATVQAGDICALTGIEGFEIGDTIADIENPEPLATIAIDEPTMSMLFTINDSPFFGKDGKFVTSRHIKDRLTKELEKNLALRVNETDSADKFLVFGRGVLHLSVLIETMRREGYELQIGQPQVIIKEIDGVKCEPVEELTIDLPEAVSGKAVEMVSLRKGEMISMEAKGDRMICEFIIPSRGIIGMRNQLLTATAGEAIMAHRYKEYQPLKGGIPERQNGSLISMEKGKAIPYSIDKLQDRGRFFVDPGEEVYQDRSVRIFKDMVDRGYEIVGPPKPPAFAPADDALETRPEPLHVGRDNQIPCRTAEKCRDQHRNNCQLVDAVDFLHASVPGCKITLMARPSRMSAQASR